MAESFSCYLALGDSMSIDYYPAQDNREPTCGRQKVGAHRSYFSMTPTSGRSLTALITNVTMFYTSEMKI
jgi:hypothetical protein